MAACAKCGAPLADGAGFCAACGTSVSAAGASAGPASGATGSAAGSSGLTPNVAGALAYFTIIPAIIFLVAEPYNKDRFIKFHAFQCLFMAGGAIAISIVMMMIAVIPIIGWIISLLFFPLFGLAMFGLVVFNMYKAYNNEKFLIPVIGKMAEQQASK